LTRVCLSLRGHLRLFVCLAFAQMVCYPLLLL
jgi:hypothetical protein